MTPEGDGGVVVRLGGGVTERWRPAGVGWTVQDETGGAAWRLVRSAEGGFVLLDADGSTELGRSNGLVGIDDPVGPRCLLLDDGRLFRVRACGARGQGFELLGWEAPGAYLRARPEGKGWRLVPTAAGGAIPDLRALRTLFAAEVLRADGGLQAGS